MISITSLLVLRLATEVVGNKTWSELDVISTTLSRVISRDTSVRQMHILGVENYTLMTQPMHANNRFIAFDSNTVSTSPVSEPGHLAPHCLIGVMTTQEELVSMFGRTVVSTWPRQAALGLGHGPIGSIFVVGGCMGAAGGGEVRFIQRSPVPVMLLCLDTPDDEYPPQKKVLLYWQFVAEHRNDHVLAAPYPERGGYTWYAKVDLDTYIDVRALQALLHNQSSAYEYAPAPARYIGTAAYGRKLERELLGLDGHPYCLGLGYVINDVALAMVGSRWKQCLTSVASNHSDTEVARCILAHSGATCENMPRHFHQIYFSRDEGYILQRAWLKTYQMSLSIPKALNSIEYASALLHSVKSANDFRRVHKQKFYGLRPLLPPLLPYPLQKRAPELDPRDYTSIKNMHEHTCVNNPKFQKSLYGTEHKPCLIPPWVSPAPINIVVPAVSPKAAERLSVHGFRTDSVAFDTSFGSHSQVNLLKDLPMSVKVLWKALAAHAKLDPLDSTAVLVLAEEDEVPRCDFLRYLLNMIRNFASCRDTLATGSVLLLGDAGLIEPNVCQEVVPEQVRSLSGVYGPAAIDEIRLFFDKGNETISTKNIIQHLMRLGYPIRGFGIPPLWSASKSAPVFAKESVSEPMCMVL